MPSGPGQFEPAHADGSPQSSALLAFLHHFGQPEQFVSGSTVFTEGDPCRGIYFVQEGELELSVVSGEKRLKLGPAIKGHVLAIADVIAERPFGFTATATRDSKLLFVDAVKTREYLRQNSEFCLHMVQFLGAELVDLSSTTMRALRLQPRYPKPPQP